MGVSEQRNNYGKYLKLSLISFIVLLIVITAVGLVFPSKVIVSRTIDVDANIDSVKIYTLNIANWQMWMIANSSNTAPLSISFPDSLTLGTYKIKVLKRSDDYIATLWHSEDMDELCTLSLYGSRQQNITTVNWKFEQQLKWYPWERFKSLLMDKILGDPMEAGLAELKRKVERLH